MRRCWSGAAIAASRFGGERRMAREQIRGSDSASDVVLLFSRVWWGDTAVRTTIFCKITATIFFCLVVQPATAQDGVGSLKLCESGLSRLISTIETHVKEYPHSLSDGRQYLDDKLRAINMPMCPDAYVEQRLRAAPFFVNSQTSSPQDAVLSRWYIFANESIIGTIEYLPGTGVFPVDGRWAKIKLTEADHRNELE
jgi:hypothetical protein